MSQLTARAESLGLNLDKPKFEQIVLPYDITMLSSEQLGEIFTKLTAWADYAAAQLTIAQLEERAAQRQLDYRVNNLLVTRMGSSAKGDRITVIKAEIAIDPDVQSYTQAVEERYTYRKLVEVLFNNYERDMQLVSREITRRSNDLRSTRSERNL